MTTQDTAGLALVGYVVYGLLAFGLRAAIHYRRTGTSGFVGIAGQVGWGERLGGALFALSLALGVAGPSLQLAGLVAPVSGFDAPWAAMAGMTLFALGLVATLWSQLAMGDSWRVGVDTAARTALVAAGPFRWVRNPIFTAMAIATLGLTLLAPNVVSFAALVTLLVGLEIHVRVVEEPYLARTHGERYRQYAARTGRFLPAIGRLT
jgi:protein-S-isoprenylcysteine O-methyltransferase Ste14